jgi:hypothetical protein
MIETEAYMIRIIGYSSFLVASIFGILIIALFHLAVFIIFCILNRLEEKFHEFYEF